MSNVYRLPKGLDGQGRYITRDTASRQIAAEQDWVNTCWQPTQMQAPRRVPFERIDHRAARSREVRKLVLWACVTWTLFCIVVAAAAVVAVS